jgi:hypothetical protein
MATELESALAAFEAEHSEATEADKSKKKLKYLSDRGLLEEAMAELGRGKKEEAKEAEKSVTFRPPAVARRGRMPDYRGCFSKRMESFIDASAACLGVLPDGIVGTVLASCSAALSRFVEIKIGSDWRETATLWVAVVGDSSTKKTPTMKVCSRFFNEKQNEFIEENKEKMKLFKKQQVQYENELKKWKAQKIATINQQPDEPDLPEMKSLYVTDATIEALIGICKSNPRGVLYFRDELSSWVAQLQRRDHEKEVGSWLQAFNGDPIVKQTVTGGEVSCKSFRVVVFGGVQPHVMPKILNEDVVDGLAPRFMLVNHDVSGDATNFRDKAHDEYMFSVLSKLFAMGQCELAVEKEAEEKLVLWANVYEKEAQKIEAGHWRSFYGKRSGFLLRMAIIFHAIDMAELGIDVSQRAISLDVATRAKRFTDNFAIPSSEIIYSKAGVSMPNNDGVAFSQTEAKVLGWLKNKFCQNGVKVDTHSMRDLYRYCKAFQKLREEKKADLFLEKLVLSGLAQIESKDSTKKEIIISHYITEFEV